MKRAALGIGAGISLLVACGGVAERAPEQEVGAASPASVSPASVSPASVSPAPASPSGSAPEPAGSDPVRVAPAFGGVNGGGAAGASATPVGCTLVGCTSGLELRLQKASAWASGVYVFRLLEEGREAAVCNVLIPPSRLSEDVAVACPGGDIRLDLGGTRQASFTTVLLSTAASQVSFEIVLDDRRLVLAEYAPEWAAFRPNGPECEPVCLGARPETLPFD